MYVGDSDNLIASQEPEGEKNRAQKSAIVYSAGVHQTDGVIRQEICRWYLISYK